MQDLGGLVNGFCACSRRNPRTAGGGGFCLRRRSGLTYAPLRALSFTPAIEGFGCTVRHIAIKNGKDDVVALRRVCFGARGSDSCASLGW
jgi:hypothetical protein